MTYSFHPEARSEFKEAILYYFEKSPPLASAFYAEVSSAIEGIIENPLLYRTIDEDVRRCLTKRFPYAILFTIEDHFILDTCRHALRHGDNLLETQDFL